MKTVLNAGLLIWATFVSSHQSSSFAQSRADSMVLLVECTGAFDESVTETWDATRDGQPWFIAIRDVAKLVISGDRVSTQVLFRDFDRFDYGRSGAYIVRARKTGKWYLGNAHPGAAPTPINEFTSDTLFADVSSKGDRIVWVRQFGRHVGGERKSEMYLLDTRKKRSRLLLVVSGYLCAPSWSPDDSLIAYIDGPPDATINGGGYTLRIIDPSREPLRPRELAPPTPNLWNSQHDRGWPPIWSPDGKMLYFESYYKITEPVNPYGYVVNVDGTGLESTSFLPWYWVVREDRKRKYVLQPISDKPADRFRLEPYVVDLSTGEKKRLTFNGKNVQKACGLPKEPGSGLMWVKNGEYLGVSTSYNRTLWLLNTETGQCLEIPNVGLNAAVHWVE